MVTALPANTAKVSAVPRSTGGCAADASRDVAKMSITAATMTASATVNRLRRDGIRTNPDTAINVPLS